MKRKMFLFGGTIAVVAVVISAFAFRKDTRKADFYTKFAAFTTACHNYAIASDSKSPDTASKYSIMAAKALEVQEYDDLVREQYEARFEDFPLSSFDDDMEEFGGGIYKKCLMMCTSVLAWCNAYTFIFMGYGTGCITRFTACVLDCKKAYGPH